MITVIKALKTKIPPPVYGLLTALLIWWLSLIIPSLLLIPPILSRFGSTLIVIGLAIDVFSLAHFFKSKTTPNPLNPKKARQVVDTGLYRFTRNPMYLGLLVALTGWALHLGNLAGFVCLPTFVWVLTNMQILPEERALSEKFGVKYFDYVNKVRRWI